MENDAKPESDPDIGSTLKASIDTAWLKLNTTETGGGKPDGDVADRIRAQRSRKRQQNDYDVK